MSKKCAVKGCENRYRHRKSNLTFHRIPKDPEIRKKWVLACKSDDSRRRHDTDARVCCTHFEESSYEPTSLKYTLLNIAVPKNQRRLKAGAVPTILLPHQQDDEAQNGATDSCVTSSPHTGQHFETKDDAAQNGATDSCVTSSPHTGQHFETKDGAAPNDATTSFENDSVGENELHLQVQQLLQDRTSLQRIVAEREAKIVVLHKAKMKKEKELNAMEKEIGKLQDSLRCSQDKICIAKKNLSQMFSRSQIDHIFAEKNITNWSEDDISRALTLKSLSPKAYFFLREKWNFPLPSKSTLNRHARKMDAEPGILLAIMNLLKFKAEAMPERDRVCALSFDECSISKEWSYDKGKDILYGPKQSAQCAMIRGLFAPWKQLVFYDFDSPMTKEILLDIIINVEFAGFPVVAIVNDLGPTNVKLWKSLGVSTENTCFSNPANSERKIYIFADAPHLIKLIRNNFLDSGFLLADGNKVSHDCVTEIIARAKHDLKITHRLSDKHIHVTGPSRMNVKLAVQLLSGTTAKALKYFGEKQLLTSMNWKCTSEFIELSNAWFDVFNSRVWYDAKSSRNAYGTDISTQDIILSRMTDTVAAMKVCGSNKMYQFQKGLMISSQSLPKLFDMLKEMFGISYLLTCRLNQDCLEHFFAIIRQMGGKCDHPSAVSFKHRIRVHLLSKDSALVGDKYNVVRDCDVHNLTPTTSTEASANTQGKELQEELCLTAMLFACEMPDYENQENLTEGYDIHIDHASSNLEYAIQEEGELYLGGYIAHKFPEYKLGAKVSKVEKKTMCAVLSWKPGSLMHPSAEFLQKLKITDTLTANKSNKEIINLLTSDTLLEESLEKIVSFTEPTPEVRESLGVALFQAVSQVEQELCAQVTGMLLELPIPSVTQLLADRELLAEAVTKSREEYLNFIQAEQQEVSTETLSREKEEVGEVIYEKLVEQYPGEAAKLTGMLLQMDYKDLVRVIAEPDLFRKKVKLALSVLKSGQDIKQPPPPPV